MFRKRKMTQDPSTKQSTPADSVPVRCSFCNKAQDDVKKVIAGPTVMICDECVAVCVNALADDAAQAIPKDSVEVQRWRAKTAQLARGSDSALCNLCGKSAFSREMLPLGTRGSLCSECADAIEDALARGRPVS